MLLLLPPSEGKTPPASGDAVSLAALSHPELADARRRVGDALVKVSGQRNAMKVLEVGASLADEVARNVDLWSAPADAAARVYTGVLYDAARMAEWDGPMLARAAERVRIVSALWGAVSPADAVPAYRLSMATSLGRLGGLAAFWRPRLAPVLSAVVDGGLVVDCRSSSYVAAWKPGAEAAWVSVRVLRELDGKRSVVSHMAKHTRGLLAAHLVAADAVPGSPGDLADAASQLIGRVGDVIDVGLDAGGGSGRPNVLTIVVRG